MGFIILGLVSIVLGCLILGNPFALLLSSWGFWLVLISILVLTIICNYFLRVPTDSLNIYVKALKSICLTITIIAIPFTFFATCLMPSFRDTVLSFVGMGDHLGVFHDINVSVWRYILFFVAEIVLLGIYGTINGSDKTVEKIDDVD